MRERKVDVDKRRRAVRVWLGGNYFPYDNEVRQHISINRIYRNGRSSWAYQLNYIGSTYEYRVTTIVLSFSAVFWGLWELTHR